MVTTKVLLVYQEYHYNTGSADNGYSIIRKEYPTTDQAKKDALRLKRLLGVDDYCRDHPRVQKFLKRFIEDGFVNRVIGIEEVVIDTTTKLISLEN